MAKFKPYLLADRAEYYNRMPIVAAAETFCGVLGVYAQTFMPGVSEAVVVRPCLIDIDDSKRYSRHLGDLQENILRLKKLMLEYGGSPEAVRLINDLAPFTKKELNIMADKLSKKGAKPAAKKEAATPKGTGRKGNPEALEKAREARAGKRAELQADKRKLALTDKGKEKIKKNAESGAAQNLIAMRDAKTVGAFITNGGSMADIRYAEKSETVTVG